MTPTIHSLACVSGCFTVISQSLMSNAMFWICSPSVPFVAHTRSAIGFLYREQVSFTVNLIGIHYSVTVQKQCWFYVDGTSHTMFCELFFWGCSFTYVCFPPSLTILESPTWCSLIYWPVNSSTSTLQFFNLPNDCCYWSCFALQLVCSMWNEIQGEKGCIATFLQYYFI